MSTDLFELRQYTLVPGGLDDLVDLFEGELVGPQVEAGMRLHGRYEDLADRDRFVWLRSFPSDDARTAACTAFYTGPAWVRYRDATNATLTDSDDVLLLREPWPGSFDAVPEGEVVATVWLLDAPVAEGALDPTTAGGVLVTAEVPNHVPRLPVREGEHAVVVLATEVSTALPGEPAQVLRLRPVRPRSRG
ncbi:NIPSNAP family protein [Oryzobacter telluris]|uniref:NIPSNAP family protein n=1 Tax=Oryzobacter telluris TaxID=3149179 RepID=UPI00370D06DB